MERRARRVPFLGLTGGIGAGKSEALRAFAGLGAATLSTDEVAHALLATDLSRTLIARLGPGVAPGGQLDRSLVAEQAFRDDDTRAWLEALLWPRVGARVAEWRLQVEAREPPPRAAVVEVPLLFESGMQSVFDATIAVFAPEELRAERAGGRGHAALAERERRQLSQQQKAHQADFVVANDGTLDELGDALSHVLATLEAVR